MTTTPEDITLHTEDRHSLRGSWFQAPGGRPHTGLVINSGTGIPRGFYRRFASFAAERGFSVLTYDYRGIGESAPPALRGSEIRYRDWGQRDMPAALAWMHERHPDVPLAVVGHSTGGQQLGLAANVELVDAALFVAVSTGYWRDMPRRQRWFTWTLWHLLVPLFHATLGYFPARRFGLGEDLPGLVATEWGAWCKEPSYMAAYFDDVGHRTSVDGRAFGALYFDRAAFPILAYCFADDPVANRVTVPPMLRLYARARVDTRWVEPSDLAVAEIGPLGFFRERVGHALWVESLDRLRAAAQRERRADAPRPSEEQG